ncbi:exopolysaccharide biosynthesis protein [Ponticoccus alexandrii]|uniref:Exopolysaccharide biosynthesis protein n=1 Tax=Ponticoccus alexandrii TaxID=1943633 RepID=A0ABX7FB69_9RHOB|nr:exopolysaccharide biosynthesis protein [Ponticoccus alexandrii]QRF67648.1 exopolysaccharide biosynthesis protein [Ponticoccus alexandrii]
MPRDLLRNMAEEPEVRSPESLDDLLKAMRPEQGDLRVSVEDVLRRVGAGSFPAVILVPAIVLVSPISGIPGTPTLAGMIVLLCAVQALVGKKHLWLPGFLRRRSVSAARMLRAVEWLRRPAGWMDRHAHNRLRLLVSGPAKPLAYAATALVAVSWPLLELLPFFTSFSAGAVAMVMFGLMTRDGAYALAGYAQGALIYLTLLSIWFGIF